MDRLIKRFEAVPHGDLMFTSRGIAYQGDQKPFNYGEQYFECYQDYDNNAMAAGLNKARCDLVAKYHSGTVLDVGVGAGGFVRSRPNTYGYDVNPKAIEWLKSQALYAYDPELFDALTFWDVIEHIPDVNCYFKNIKKGAYLFTSIPIFKNLESIFTSKHYKPNEHLYYFTEEGFIFFMSLYGFRLIESNDVETRLGRDSIRSFVFKKDLPDYHYMLEQYKELHCSKHYGDSAWMYVERFLPHITELEPKKILDFGCGRSDLVAYFYKDGERVLERYDPAIPKYKKMPDGAFDLVFCCDVMEHILMRDVDHILAEVKAKSNKVIFTIFLAKSRAELPDGQNAHVTLLTRNEWMRWLSEYFNPVDDIGSGNNVLMVRTW